MGIALAVVGALVALFGAWLVLATGGGLTTSLGGSPYIFGIPFGGLEWPLVVLGIGLMVAAVLLRRRAAAG